MYKCSHCNIEIPDNQAEGRIVKVGPKDSPKCYCMECGEPVVYIPDMPQATSGIHGAQATLISNSDNHIITNNYYGGGVIDEQVDTPYGRCKKSDARLCKKCRQWIPLLYFDTELGLCDECITKEGNQAYEDGKMFFDIGLYNEALDSFIKYERICKRPEELAKLYYLLGRCYFEQKQWKDAFRYFVKTREINADSFYYIGLYYYNGYGEVPKDERKAQEHFEKAIQKGSQKAMDFIAEEKRRIQEEQKRKQIEYKKRLEAEIFRRKKEKEEKLRREEEKKQTIEALVKKARNAYSNREYQQAVEYFKDAEKLGYVLSAYEYNLLGLSCCEEKRYHEAIQYFHRAASVKSIYAGAAMVNLANCYEYGLGVDEDLKEAFKWYTDAANQGESKAGYKLGLFYAHSDKVGNIKKRYPQRFLSSTGYLNYEKEFPCPRDIEEAKNWFKMVADYGNGNDREAAKQELLLLTK